MYDSIPLCWRLWSMEPEFGNRPDSGPPEVIIQDQQSWVKRPWFWLRWTRKEMGCDPVKKPPNSHPRLQEDASSTEGLASRRGCCISPCMSLFWRHIPTRVPFLSFGEGDRETIELVDSQTRLTKVTLYCYSYLHKEKKIKKIVSRLKPSQI